MQMFAVAKPTAMRPMSAAKSSTVTRACAPVPGVPAAVPEAYSIWNVSVDKKVSRIRLPQKPKSSFSLRNSGPDAPGVTRKAQVFSACFLRPELPLKYRYRRCRSAALPECPSGKEVRCIKAGPHNARTKSGGTGQPGKARDAVVDSRGGHRSGDGRRRGAADVSAGIQPSRVREQMGAAVGVCRLLRAVRAVRRLPAGPPEDGAKTEAAARVGVQAQRGAAASGGRGFAAIAAGHRPLSGPADDGIPPGIDDAAAIVTADREAQIFFNFPRQGQRDNAAWRSGAGNFAPAAAQRFDVRLRSSAIRDCPFGNGHGDCEGDEGAHRRIVASDRRGKQIYIGNPAVE